MTAAERTASVGRDASARSDAQTKLSLKAEARSGDPRGKAALGRLCRER
jgi:hypothetical protein